MRLHTDTITEQDIRAAAERASAAVHAVVEYRSRARGRAWEVFLTGHGKTGGQYGGTDAKTASWDEWGMALAHLFELDPAMVVGTPGRPIYRNRDYFHAVTGGRYRHLLPGDACHYHRWDHLGATWRHLDDEMGEHRAYHRRCKRCGADLYVLATPQDVLPVTPTLAGAR